MFSCIFSTPSIVDLSIGQSSSSPFQQYLQRRAEESALARKAANLSKQIAQFKLSRADVSSGSKVFSLSADESAALQLVGRVTIPVGASLASSSKVVLCVDDLLKLHEKLLA
jgi:hypothetical protein